MRLWMSLSKQPLAAGGIVTRLLHIKLTTEAAAAAAYSYTVLSCRHSAAVQATLSIDTLFFDSATGRQGLSGY